jgi:WD40 repeat protein
MVVASSGVQVKLFETGSGRLLRTFETRESHTSGDRTICCGSESRAAVFSPDGNIIVSGHEDGTIKLWGVKTGKLVRLIKSRSSDVRSVIISPNGNLIASGNRGDKGRIELWSARTGKLVRRLGEESDYVESIAFSPDSSRLVSGHLMGTRLWNVRTGRLLREFERGFSLDDQVAFSPDGKRIVSGGENQNVLLWDAKSSRLIWSLIPIEVETRDRE